MIQPPDSRPAAPPHHHRGLCTHRPQTSADLSVTLLHPRLHETINKPFAVFLAAGTLASVSPTQRAIRTHLRNQRPTSTPLTPSPACIP